MGQIIDVPGQGQVEFPDGMSDTDIVAAIKRNGLNRPASAKPKAPAWSDVPMQAVKNLLPSAGNLLSGIGHAIAHPIDTAGNVLDMGAGALQNALPAGVKNAIDRIDPNPQAGQRAVAVADAAGKFFKDRYGSADGLKTTLATDPVGAALDLSTILTGGGTLAAKIPGLSTAGRAAVVAGGAVDPISATIRATRGAAGAGMRKVIDQPAMAQRIADLKAGGIDNPSLGLATGSSFVSGLENLLAQTPGSIGLFDRARASNVAGMQGKTEAIREALSSEYGPVVAGEAIQGDLKGAFRNRISKSAKALNERVAGLVGRDTIVPVDNALDAATRLSTPIAGAEATSAEFINPRISRIAQNLRDDVYGAQPNPAASSSFNPTANLPLAGDAPAGMRGVMGMPSAPDLPVGMGGVMGQPAPVSAYNPLPQRANVAAVDARAIPNASLWNAQKEKGIPFDALKQLRTSIGDEAASTAIMGTPEQAQFKRLYAGLSEDMRGAAGSADRNAAGVKVGPLPLDQQPASIALNRANTFYSRAMNRADELNGLAMRDTPEGAYKAVANSLQSGPTVYERLRSAITPEARQKVAATVVDELGRSTPGTQNMAGDVWSPRTFLTNYNKLYRNDGGPALFTRMPGGATYAENLAKVAKAAEMLGDGAKVWSNPSGTSQALVARGTLGTIGAGAVGGIFYTPLIAPAAVAGGSLLLAHQVSQRLLLNPKFVSWLAKAPTARTPAQVSAHAKALLVTARMTNDPQFQQDANDYVQGVESQ